MIDFTPAQTLAITRRQGELMLDAGAGSGKTAVLVERFAASVLEDGIAVGQILAITFTDKAAAELRERVRARLAESGDEPAARATDGAWITTFHSFCARVLRAHAIEAGLDPEFVVLDEQGAATLRSRAFDAALAESARTGAGTGLLAAYGRRRLRAAVPSIYAELRARGALVPALPPVPADPGPATVDAACELVVERAAQALRELRAVAKPGVQVREAMRVLEEVPAALAPGCPWPGELQRLRLTGRAAALASDSCGRFREALAALEEIASAAAAVPTRAELDALLARYGHHFGALKRRRSALDFSDLELLARELLRTPEIQGRYRERFATVMVDEMQDTNRVQLELVELVAGPNLVMVGDAQQSIYGFRHADVELFEERGRLLSERGARLPLPENFRSRPEILTALNGAFRQALGARFRGLVPGRQAGPPMEPRVELIVAGRERPKPAGQDAAEPVAAPWRLAEARALAARVAELIATGDARPGEVAVLVRASTDLRVYERALEQAGVPTYLIGGRGYWSDPQLAELVSYLRALANPLDEEALYTVLLSPLCGLSLDGLVLTAAAAEQELAAGDRSRLSDFRRWFDGERRLAAWLGPEELLDRALQRDGYELQLAGLPGSRRRIANVRKLLGLAARWQQQHGSDLRGFVDHLQEQSDSEQGAREGEAPVESEALDAVRLMTIHRAKGLEFPVVCVADLGRQTPSRSRPMVLVGGDGQRLGLRLRRAGEGQEVSVLAYEELREQERERELDEERRLFYVAATRARERLILSGAAWLEGWQKANGRAPIGWLGQALVPDIAARAYAAAAARAAGSSPQPSVTDGGVLVHFPGSDGDPSRLGAGTRPAAAGGQASAGGPGGWPAGRDHQRAAALHEPMAASGSADVLKRSTSAAVTAPPRLSYTALATLEQCGYRFYAERVLGLAAADMPRSMVPAHAAAAGSWRDRSPDAMRRGILIHELLAAIDLCEPGISEPVDDELRGLLTGLFASAAWRRLTRLRDPRREQPFALTVAGTLIHGVFDVLGWESADQLLVVDYKSDQLGGQRPEALVAARYTSQRAIYALAGLRLGAQSVEVVHLFLEVPAQPVTVRYTSADMPALEDAVGALVARAAGDADGFAVTGAPGRQICEGCPAREGLCSHPPALTVR
ncbi:MAG: UvrD-helicase domain-containing protein [Actinomycetota bacterium]|nr:UvrD-helicase domain-containing protein [Actinomycetota bacterium]